MCVAEKLSKSYNLRFNESKISFPQKNKNFQKYIST